MPADGTCPTGTTQWEKRNIALEIPVWDEELCIQCGKCSIVCPHATIRIKVYDPGCSADAPQTFKSRRRQGHRLQGHEVHHPGGPRGLHRLRRLRAHLPGQGQGRPKHKAINMQFQPPLREPARPPTTTSSWRCPNLTRAQLKLDTVKGSQLLQPLFEYSGACAGCGETPYVKLLTQLFGDRAMIANATGCSSIYGGNLPTTPWTNTHDGRGPAWSNSLFEDNAEFGFGMRLAVDKFTESGLRTARASVAEIPATKLAGRDPRRRPGRPRRGSTPSASAWPQLKEVAG